MSVRIRSGEVIERVSVLGKNYELLVGRGLWRWDVAGAIRHGFFGYLIGDGCGREDFAE